MTKSGNAAEWTPTTWRQKPIVQVLAYADKALLAAVEDDLRTWPPLTIADEIRRLRRHLGRVAERKAFPVAGLAGRQAEAFAEHPPIRSATSSASSCRWRW